MDAGFWNGRRVLVTGHTGFKGSWLCLWLQHLSADVVGYALEPPTEPSLFELGDVADGMESIIADIRDVEHMSSVFREHQPEILLHLAAQTVVRESYVDPIETYSTNVVGTASVLQAARETTGPLAIVNVTSDKCYENREWLWGYRETDQLGGRDPYSNSKACAELVTSSFRDSFFAAEDYASHRTTLSSARAGNVIGGGDWTADQLIPDIVGAFQADEPVLIRNPDAVRPWQHVLDCLDGYLTLAQRMVEEGLKFSGAWNFGPSLDNATSVLSIVQTLAERWGSGATWRIDNKPKPHEAGLLRLDNTKAVTELRWAPRMQIEQALEWTLDWYEGLRSRRSARELCEEQLGRYDSLSPSTVR